MRWFAVLGIGGRMLSMRHARWLGDARRYLSEPSTGSKALQ